MIISRDWQEISVLECILSGLHIDVDVESVPERAWKRLCKTKIDAVVVDCDTEGTHDFFQRVQGGVNGSMPIMIASGTPKTIPVKTGAIFVVEKPVSVAQAVQTFSAARNLILHERLRYYREPLDLPAKVLRGKRSALKARIKNISRGGTKLISDQPLSSGEAIKLSFSLPGSRGAIKTEGRVAWADKHGNAGVRFAAMQDALQRKLQFWIDRRYFQERELCDRLLNQ